MKRVKLQKAHTLVKLTAAWAICAVGLWASAPVAAQSSPSTPSTGTTTQCGGNGAADPDKTCAGAGNPLNVVTGNKYQREVDLPALPGVLGLEVVRHYNSTLSRDSEPNGILGKGWRLGYEYSLYVIGNTYQIIEPDGQRHTFARSQLDPNVCVSADPMQGRIQLLQKPGDTQYVWSLPSGRQLRFGSRGQLDEIRLSTGEFLSLQYDVKGRLSQVTDPQGRALKIKYHAGGQQSAGQNPTYKGIASIETPVGEFTYQYGSALPKGSSAAPAAVLANLVSASLPKRGDGTQVTRQYFYEDAKFPTLLTGLGVQSQPTSGKPVQERLATYRYDSLGRAHRSEHGSAVELTDLQLASPLLGAKPGRVVLVHSQTPGNPRGYALEVLSQQIAGEFRITQTRGVPCPAQVNCPAANVRYRLDERGHVTEVLHYQQPLVKATDHGKAKGWSFGELTQLIGGERYEMDGQGRVTKRWVVQPAQGASKAKLVEELAYDGLSERVAVVRRPSVVAGQWREVRTRYNDKGQPVQVQESGWRPALGTAAAQPMVRSVSYAYKNINGRSVLVSVDGPLPGAADTTHFEWDARADHLMRSSSGDGTQRSMTRDASGRVINDEFSDAHRVIRVTNVYSPSGQVIESTRSARLLSAHADSPELQEKIKQAFDAGMQLSKREEPLTGVFKYQSDSSGRLLAVEDADGRGLAFAHDAEGQWRAWIARDASQVVQDGGLDFYAPSGDVALRLSPHRDEQRQAALASYDYKEPPVPWASPAERADTVLRPMREAQRHYQAEVDDFGRVVRDSSPIEGVITYQFGETPTGTWRLKSHQDRQGRFIQSEKLEFDASGRLLKRIRGSCTQQLVYTGLLLSELKGCGDRTQYTRDAWGRITEKVSFVSGRVFTERYAYDDAGWMYQRELVGGQMLFYERARNTSQLRSVYLEREWLMLLRKRISIGLASALNKVLPNVWTRVALLDDRDTRFWDGQAQAWLSVGGVRTVHSHTREGRIGTIAVSDTQNQRLVSLSYQFDVHGLTRAMNDAADHRQPSNGRAVSISYRMPQGVMVRPALAHPDALVDRSMATTVSNDTLLARGAHPRLMPDRVDGFGRVIERDVDKGGHRLTQHFEYDEAGRLARVKEGQTMLASYQYDAHGDRVAKTVWLKGIPAITYYVYDSQHRLAAEVLPDGTTRHYLYDGMRPYAMLINGEAFAVHTDGRSLPVAMTDAQQRIVWRGQFDADGNLLNEQGRTTIALRMPGQMWDEETGLFYNVNRYYDPRAGRYINPDPLGWTRGEDAYDYAGGHPLDASDPLGLFEIPVYDFFGFSTTPVADGGHGDIVRTAFQLYAMQPSVQEQRFSQAIIDQIVRNNYHTDAASTMYVVAGGGGQFFKPNHYDNPNDGPMYLDAGMTKVNPGYTNTTWIKDSVDQLNKNRGEYSQVLEFSGSFSYGISGILSNFGRSTHTLADFYAHSNWVDASDRGGCVNNKRLFGGDEIGFVPYGLAKTEVWNEDVSSSALKLLYSGTVSLEPSLVMGCVNDIGCSNDKTTHGYWAKDHDGVAVFSKGQIDTYRSQGLNFYGVHEYNPGMYVDEKQIGPGQYRQSWWAEDPESGVLRQSFGDVKKGDRIYVNQDIYNPYRLARALAVQATLLEIDKLYKTAQGVKLGDLLLTDVFKMDDAALNGAQIKYKQYFDKSN